MRLFALLFVVFALSTGHLAAVNGPEFTDRIVASFEAIDLYPLQKKIAVTSKLEPDENLEDRIRRNLRYIFHNKLNRTRLLVTPAPEYVVERIEHIFAARNQIGELIREGRGLVHNSGNKRQMQRVVRDIGKLADGIEEDFSDTFLEGHSSTFSFEVPISDEAPVQFMYFLVHSQRISHHLSERLDRYFLNETPGAESVSDFSSSTITTLAASLLKLTRVVNSRLARIPSR